MEINYSKVLATLEHKQSRQEAALQETKDHIAAIKELDRRQKGQK